ncbi:hypothetical protein ACFWC6_32215 [Micromonospora chalcea]
MPSRMLFELTVEMEDGTTHDVVADQRDISKWEAQDFGCPFEAIPQRTPMLAMRWIAWSALSRRGLTDLKWPEFDAECIEVRDFEGDGEVQAKEADPTNPAPSATTSSRSRSGRAKR